MFKKYKIILASILLIALLCFCTEVNAADIKYCTLKYEAVAKSAAGGLEFILPANTVVKYLSRYNKTYVYCQYKVSYNNTLYTKQGYFYASSLKVTNNASYNPIKIKDSKALNVIVNKLEIVYWAHSINKLGVTYNDTISKRTTFYRKLEQIAKLKESTYKRSLLQTDCSSLCATIYNRTLNYNMYRDTAKTNVWVVTEFVDNAKDRFVKSDTGRKGTRGFYVVKEVHDGRSSIPLNTMQIGDCVALAKESNYWYDHMYMYIGDGALIESIAYDGGNNKNYNKVIIRRVPQYFYTAQTGDAPGQWYDIVLMRPLYKYMSL